MTFQVGDWVSHVHKPHRGAAIIKVLTDGHAVIYYPKYDMVVHNIRTRDLKLEEAPK